MSFPTASIPAEWKHTIIISILKSGKEKSCVTSYRLIALVAITIAVYSLQGQTISAFSMQPPSLYSLKNKIIEWVR